MKSNNYARELFFLRRAAQEASRLSQRFTRQGFHVRGKLDGSIVTDADVACEKAIRHILSKAFPQHGFLGEECGESESCDGSRFIIDPIDGTSNFARGIPSYGPIIALEEDGEVVAGAFTLTPLNLKFWAAKGQGAYLNGKRIHVSDVDQVGKSAMSFGNPRRMFKDHAEKPWLRIVRQVAHARGFGDLMSYGLVASGHVDIAIESWPKPWDIAAPKIVIEEAGGSFTNQKGVSTIYGKKGDWVVATNGRVHQETIGVLLGKRKAKPVTTS